MGTAGLQKGEMGKCWTIAAKFAAKLDRRRLGALAVLLLESLLVSVVLSCNYGYAHRTSTDGDVSAGLQQDRTDRDWFARAPELAKTDRTLYPYSVIPGGVRNSAELRNAVAHDEVVARHYSDFDLRRVHVARLKEARAVFVSFRVGSRIFWTKNRLNLPAGETVVTDGEHMARTRCGNRISEAPVGPVLNNEPSPEAMEIPADGGLLAAVESASELPIGPPPTSTITVPEQPAGSIFIPIIPPLFPIGGVPSSPGIPSGPPPPPSPLVPPPPPPPISTPEPSGPLMLLAGCACILLLRRIARA
jgi:hypothetical protein